MRASDLYENREFDLRGMTPEARMYSAQILVTLGKKDKSPVPAWVVAIAEGREPE